jgi:hypothetical protein
MMLRSKRECIWLTILSADAGEKDLTNLRPLSHDRSRSFKPFYGVIDKISLSSFRKPVCLQMFRLLEGVGRVDFPECTGDDLISSGVGDFLPVAGGIRAMPFELTHCAFH